MSKTTLLLIVIASLLAPVQGGSFTSPREAVPELFRSDVVPQSGATIYFQERALQAAEFSFTVGHERYTASTVDWPADSEAWQGPFPGESQRIFRIGDAEEPSYFGIYGMATFGVLSLPDGRSFTLQGYGNSLQLTPVPAGLRPRCDGTLVAQGERGRPDFLRVTSTAQAIESVRRRSVTAGMVWIRVLMLDEQTIVQAAASSDIIMAHHLAFTASVNALFLQSEIKNIRVVLANVRAAPPSLGGSASKVLSALRKNAEVAQWAKEDQADVIGCRIKSGGNMATSPQRESDFHTGNSFFVYDDWLALESKTAQHEFGHLLACQHDFSVRGPARPGEYNFNYAWRDPDNRFATIMSVEAGPGDVYPPVLLRFSALRGAYSGRPVGHALANNAAMAVIGAELVSQYHRKR